MRLPAGIPVVAFFADDISGSRAPALFLVGDGAPMIAAAAGVPERSAMPLSARCASASAKTASAGPRRSGRCRKSGIVSFGLAPPHRGQGPCGPSGMRPAPNSIPANRRIAAPSWSVSAAIGPLGACRFCRRQTRSMVSGGTGGRPPSGPAFG
jgi:hypothetical protein